MKLAALAIAMSSALFGAEQVRLNHTSGEVTIEGSDRTDIAVEGCRAERRGDETVISTTGPECRILAPRSARLVGDHQKGEVHVEDLTGDVHLTVKSGEITLRLAPDGEYGIDAKSKVGDVVSDFPGGTRQRRWFVGHRFTRGGSGQKLYLRAGFGDILILKIR